MKIVLNQCAGTFSLSEAAIEKILSQKGNIYDLQSERIQSTTDDYRRKRRPVTISDSLTIDRNDPVLVSVVEELGPHASGPEAELAVVIMPETSDWSIGDVFGIEFVSARGKVGPTMEADNKD